MAGILVLVHARVYIYVCLLCVCMWIFSLSLSLVKRNHCQRLTWFCVHGWCILYCVSVCTIQHISQSTHSSGVC